MAIYQPESIGDIIHKESSKEKLKTKSLKPLGKTPQAKGLKDFTDTSQQLQMSNEQRTKGEQLTAYRLKKLRINSEIDRFLHDLLIDGLINQSYWSFHAKAVHTLGIQFCNMIAINSRNGTNPQKLYAFKIKGALQVYHKQQFDDPSTNTDTPRQW